VTRRLYIVAFVAVAAMAVGAVWFAANVDPNRVSGQGPVNSAGDLPVLADSVPSLDASQGWLNSAPLTQADLRGKVVVYDFWTYSCINCVRTIPYVRTWYDRYKADGLVVVGVHTPEFDFEKNHDNVRRAVQQLGVDWPVAFDDDMTIWNQFSNNYWPAKYVVDREGKLRFVHFGEGDYTTNEDVIRVLLGVPAGAPRAGTAVNPAPDAAKDQTQETYLGPFRGLAFRQFGSPEPLTEGDASFTIPSPPPDEKFALGGRWKVSSEYVESDDAQGELVLRYHAVEVDLVAAGPGTGTARAPTAVVVELDGAPVPDASRPPGMTLDAQGRTVLTVGAADLFRVVIHGPPGRHTLSLRPQSAGVQLFSFTFGGA
jgi:thiol-disulfide isomerase/thioredoxin